MTNLKLINFLMENGLLEKKRPSRVVDLAIILEAIYDRIENQIDCIEIEGEIYTDYSATYIRDRIPYLALSTIGTRLKTLESGNIIESQVLIVDLGVNKKHKALCRRIINQEVVDILSGEHNDD